VGLFRVERRGGSRVMSQVATPEEQAKKLVADGDSDTLETALEEVGIAKAAPSPPKEAMPMQPEDASPAFKALQTGLYKQSIAWAQKFIGKLKTVKEIEEIVKIEKLHPKYEGGRVTIMKALKEQEITLDPYTVVSEEKAQEEDLFCSHCDFRAGSPDGLAAHIAANHL
jgi:hypothetical protein